MRVNSREMSEHFLLIRVEPRSYRPLEYDGVFYFVKSAGNRRELWNMSTTLVALVVLK